MGFVRLIETEYASAKGMKRSLQSPSTSYHNTGLHQDNEAHPFLSEQAIASHEPHSQSLCCSL